MSDLISRSALLEEIKCYQMDIVSKATAMKVIRNQPTAYDVDKVVEELEIEITENPEASLGNYRAGLYKAIEIVKGGGVNERD